jgi:hypothetical protein
MWIITRAINQYDQDGDYMFSAYVCDKPSREELRILFYGTKYNPTVHDKKDRDDREKFISNLLNGGGRMDVENEWYYLTEIKSGEIYKSK